MTPALATALERLDRTTDELCDSLTAYSLAQQDHADATEALHDAEASARLDGLDGKNEADRTAQLRAHTVLERQALHERAQALTDLRAQLEVARARQQAARYHVRALVGGDTL